MGYRAAQINSLSVGRDIGLVVAAGICGALAPGLAAGALVTPEVVVTPAGASYPADPAPGVELAGRLVTVDEVVATPEAKARLRRETGADAVDMESALVLRWARAAGLRTTVVRGVADVAATAVPADLAAVVGSDGRVRTSRAIRTVLRRPRALAQAMALRSATIAALDTVAAALQRILAGLA